MELRSKSNYASGLDKKFASLDSGAPLDKTTVDEERLRNIELLRETMQRMLDSQRTPCGTVDSLPPLDADTLPCGMDSDSDVDEEDEMSTFAPNSCVSGNHSELVSAGASDSGTPRRTTPLHRPLIVHALSEPVSPLPRDLLSSPCPSSPCPVDLATGLATPEFSMPPSPRLQPVPATLGMPPIERAPHLQNLPCLVEMPTPIPTVDTLPSMTVGVPTQEALPPIDGDDEDSGSEEEDLRDEHPTLTPSSELARARALADAGKGIGGLRTLMLRCIPSKYLQPQLRSEIDAKGFAGKYDFLYLPMDPRNRRNRGFAFLNFKTAAFAQEFYDAFHQGSLLEHPSEKRLGVTTSDLQGYDEIATHFSGVDWQRRPRDSRPLFLGQRSAAPNQPCTAAQFPRAPGPDERLSQGLARLAACNATLPSPAPQAATTPAMPPGLFVSPVQGGIRGTMQGGIGGTMQGGGSGLGAATATPALPCGDQVQQETALRLAIALALEKALQQDVECQVEQRLQPLLEQQRALELRLRTIQSRNENAQTMKLALMQHLTEMQRENAQLLRARQTPLPQSANPFTQQQLQRQLEQQMLQLQIEELQQQLGTQLRPPAAPISSLLQLPVLRS